MPQKLPWCIVPFFLLPQLSTSGTAQEAPDHITVSGTATTEVTPDMMSWNLQVKNQNQNLEKVAETHTDAVRTVLDFLNAQNLPQKSIQTSGMQFGQNWTYQDRERVKDGFFASTDISFKFKDLTKYTKLWIGLSRLPNVTLNGVYYDHSRRIEYRNTTRKNALLAAKSKAEGLAKALGSNIGRPLSIEEVSETFGLRSSNFNVSNSMNSAAGTSGDSPNLAPGQIPITMRVQVSFLLITE
ncbi:MAG TPA: hypothetical protein DEF45_19585 [Rhodopirellula sp.]|nr:MAG: hypothetical protein CBD74_08365 [Saprospirales bacterium TMED214]HBV65216.1 hypothetical protein [Rhodopirellula sp.]